MKLCKFSPSIHKNPFETPPKRKIVDVKVKAIKPYKLPSIKSPTKSPMKTKKSLKIQNTARDEEFEIVGGGKGPKSIHPIDFGSN